MIVMNDIQALEINISKEGREFILNNISKILESKIKWTNSVFVNEFEKAFNNFTETEYSIAVSSGSTAIESLLIALNIDCNSTIFVPTLTAPATILSCLNTCARIVLIDSDKDDLGLDLSDLEFKIRKYKTDEKAVIIPVHNGGIISANIKKIIEISIKYNCFVIEDCAHSHGTKLNTKHCGLFGIAGTFSFFLTKVLTSGEGGIIITNEEKIANKIKQIRNYGKNEKGSYVIKGSSWRMNEFTAVVALWQVINAEKNLNERRKIAKIYDLLLKNNEFYHPFIIPKNCQPSFYKYIVKINKKINREKLKSYLKKKGINLPAELYPKLCHEEPFIKSVKSILNLNDFFSNADNFARNHICLPIYPGLKENDMKYIIDMLNSYISL